MPAVFGEPVLSSKSLGEEIVDVLQREIIAGAFRPGLRLVERELIRRFSVSSIPVREALQELENRGLVVKRYNCGCSVVQLTAKEVSRICELRRVLEPQVMRWAAERVTPAASSALSEQLSRLDSAAARQDLAAFFHEDLRFHRMLWEIGDNAYASRALETVLGSLFASGMIGAGEATRLDLPGEVEKHQRLLSAICDRDGQRAALALLEIAAGFEKHLP
jgi:GntR family transcriptional regulator of gluconate operon